MTKYESLEMDLTTLQEAAEHIRRATDLIDTMLDDDINNKYADLICALDETRDECNYQIKRVSREAARAYQRSEDCAWR